MSIFVRGHIQGADNDQNNFNTVLFIYLSKIIEEGSSAPPPCNYGGDFVVNASVFRLILGNVLFILLVESVTITADVAPHW